MKRRYYIKPTGSTRYDHSGITFPVKHPVDWIRILEDAGAIDIEWDYQDGIINLPLVLQFKATETVKKQITQDLGTVADRWVVILLQYR